MTYVFRFLHAQLHVDSLIKKVSREVSRHFLDQLEEVKGASDAAFKGNLGAVELLVPGGADTESRVSTSLGPNITALHLATHEGHRDIVEVLIRGGADTESRVSTSLGPNITALHLATHEGHRDIVEVLIRGGADANSMITVNSDAPL